MAQNFTFNNATSTFYKMPPQKSKCTPKKVTFRKKPAKNKKFQVDGKTSKSHIHSWFQALLRPKLATNSQIILLKHGKVILELKMRL